MSLPVIKVGNCLIATLTEEIGDQDGLDLQQSINQRIEETSATGVLLDISALHTIDSFLGRVLNEITAGARLLGADTVVAGMQPAVAMTLVELGLPLRGVRSALDAERGLTMLGQHLNANRSR